MQEEWYVISNIDKIDSPALLFYRERIAENITLAVDMVGDANRLRPHVKTNKSPDVCRMMLAEGISKFKCATIAEAEMLAMSGAKDILLAYQPVGVKAKRLVNLANSYPRTRFSCIVDSFEAGSHLNSEAAGYSLNIPVYIDLNVGMNRTGIPPGSAVEELYQKLHELEFVRPVGLHAYDGHLRDPDIKQRTIDCDETFKVVTVLGDKLTATGFERPIIVAGGSPTFPIHANRQAVECSPGTFVFWDQGYLTNCLEQKFKPASLVLGRVISKPADDLICIDIGHKSVAAENSIDKRIYFLNHPGIEVISQSEEHLVAKPEAAGDIEIGDSVYGLPYHICPTVALYEKAYVVDDGTITGEWKIAARNRQINY